MTETLANWYSSESTQRELSNEYQYNRVEMVSKNLCILVIWVRVASSLEEVIVPQGFTSPNFTQILYWVQGLVLYKQTAGSSMIYWSGIIYNQFYMKLCKYCT